MLPYAIVRFEDGGIEAVPSAWILSSAKKQMCWWPPKYLRHKVAVAKQIQPDDDWETYPVEILKYKKTFESAHSSVMVLLSAPNMSTDDAIESTDVEKGRKRRPPDRLIDYGPVFENRKRRYSEKRVMPLNSSIESTSEEEEAEDNLPLPHHYPQKSIQLGNHTDKEVQTSDVTVDGFQEISKMIERLTNEVIRLKKEIRQNNSAEVSTDFVLPLSSVEDFERLNNLLGSPVVFNDFVKLISSSEGINVTAMCRTILHRIFVPSFAAKVTWSGRGSSIPLKQTRIVEAIISL